MTVYRPPGRRTYRYDFWFDGRRYVANTKQTRRDAALYVEGQARDRARAQAGSVPLRARESPAFQEWAEIYYDQIAARLRAPEHVRDILRVILRFFGRRPESSAGRVGSKPCEPYHDLRLLDPVQDPAWILRFETWMQARAIAPQTRNHYRSVVSRLYRLAASVQFRALTGVTANPWVGVARDPVARRTVVLTAEMLRAWIAASPPHVRLALTIAALAPKLRLANILRLRWGDEVDLVAGFIVVSHHKTAARTGHPLAVPVSRSLRRVLEAYRGQDGSAVIQYRGRPVRSIRRALRAAAARAGVRYGRDRAGVTFHTVRHAMATLLAELAVPEASRMAVMGHTDLSTTMYYTHLRPTHEQPILDRLGRALTLDELVLPMRGGKSGGTKTEIVRHTQKKAELRLTRGIPRRTASDRS